MPYIFKHIIAVFAILFSFGLYSSTPVSYCVKSPSLIFAGETYNVTITIHKNSISGSSKFEVVFPKGFEIEPINTSGSNFIFENNKAKFIWVILPQTDEINLSYTVKVPNVYSGEEKIIRKFFYVSNQKVVEDKFCSLINIVENDILFTINNNSKNIENNISFKLQVGAYVNKISSSKILEYVVDNYKIEEEFTDGFYKYTIGEFSSLELAEKLKAKSKVKNAFIIAFNNNVRISIKEAKLALEQK